MRLEEIEVLLTGSDLASDSPALAERHTKLLQSILEASIAALHVGRTLLGRVGKDDPAGNGINVKVGISTVLFRIEVKLSYVCSFITKIYIAPLQLLRSAPNRSTAE